MSDTALRDRLAGIGTSAERPDGNLKVTGQFAYASDMHLDNALWGLTIRSPHPRARITAIDISRALALDGVAAVLTADDVPGHPLYGMKVADQPVLAAGEVRYQGEPVVILAAEHPEIARAAADLVEIRYEVETPMTDPELAMEDGATLVHAERADNIVRHVRIRHGRPVDEVMATADVTVTAEYELGTQDPAFLGPEAGLAVPDPDGEGIELFVAAQWLHTDRDQIAASLGLPLEKVRLVLAGVGGAFGGREDLSVHIHVSMLALRTGRPVRMVYRRDESFVGHVHRHPGTIRVELGARRDGTLVASRVRMVLDGGAYTSTSYIVIANACYFAAGAYRVDNVEIDGFATFTNNPPRGAMRGFGAVQSAYAIESAMEKLAGALGMHPVDVRLVNALQTGDLLPTGQVVDGPTPTRELLDHLRSLPMPPDLDPAADLRTLPGGVSNTTHGEGIRRGVGYALGMKAIGFSGGVDDTSHAQVSVFMLGDEPTAEVYTSAAECGQGIVTVQAQIVRTELQLDHVVVRQADTLIADAGSSSASRQTWMTGGAVQGASRRARDELLARAAALSGADPSALELGPGVVLGPSGDEVCRLADLLDEPVVATFEYHHRQTYPIDDERGQGDAHIGFAYAAHRAVVDVDVDLGIVRVVELAAAQDVGKAINPQAVEGQIEGGSAQGLGLAVMEEVQIVDGVVKNPSFTDYLIPTILDMPPMDVKVFEFAHPDSPYGLNGVGEPPNLSSTPAIANAIRHATGLDLPRVPVRPSDIVAGR